MKKDCALLKRGQNSGMSDFLIFFIFPSESNGRLFSLFFPSSHLHFSLVLQFHYTAEQVIPIKKHLLQMETSKIKDVLFVSEPMILFRLMFLFHFFSTLEKF